jgi:magnesium chelatase family protein
MLVAALNPTPKGDMARDEASQREMQRYLARISGPLIDRVDLHVEVPAVAYRQLAASRGGTDSATIRQRVLAARATQRARQGGAVNAELSGKALNRFAAMDAAAQTLLEQAMTELGLSARAYDKIRRAARTIADLEASEDVDASHVGEAVQYRLLDRLL